MPYNLVGSLVRLCPRLSLSPPRLRCLCGSPGISISDVAAKAPGAVNGLRDEVLSNPAASYGVLVRPAWAGPWTGVGSGVSSIEVAFAVIVVQSSSVSWLSHCPSVSLPLNDSDPSQLYYYIAALSGQRLQARRNLRELAG